MKLKGKKIAVTGANGFIGGWLCKALVEQEAIVTAVLQDKEKKGSLALHGLEEKVFVKEADLLDAGAIESAIKEQELVVHLAAQSSVGKAIEKPKETFEINILGSLNVLEACRKQRASIVFASSGKVYGTQEKKVISEEDLLLAKNPYGASKACAENIAKSYFETCGVTGVITRLGNAYGPKDLNGTRLITNTIQRILSGEKPVVNGKGFSKRDFVFIEDVVSAYVLLIENIDSIKVNREAFNISTEEQHSVLQIVEKIITMCGVDIKPEFRQPDYVGVNEPVLSSQKLRKRLLWKPNYPLEKGLKKTIEWYKK